MRRSLFFLLLINTFLFQAKASDSSKASQGSEEPFDPTELIMHHISDSHVWHVISWGEGEHEKRIEIPLPVILFTKGKFSFFLFSAFDHESNIAENNGDYFLYYHGKIYNTDKNGTINLDAEGGVLNDKPIDLSITKNVCSMWLSVALILWLFISIAKRYKGKVSKPSGLQSLLEPIIIFIQEDVVLMQMEKGKGEKYVPYLLTVFFFIWINNIIGLIPFFPGGSNFTGNISVTMVLAILTFLITNISGTKSYWKHTLTAPGIPFFVKLLLVPVEIFGLFTKPFALMIRLLANITAGHIVVISLVSLIFILKTVYIAPVSILLSLVMSVLELLVAALQAYIFTLLSALFIGMAVTKEH